MGKRKRRPILIWLLCWLTGMMTLVSPARAEVSGGVSSSDNTGTDIFAGVVVDYMGKLRFLVLQQGTTVPIEGASIEIYIPGLERYVLVGTTDSAGILDLDIAYDMSETVRTEESIWGLGGMSGRFLYLEKNIFDYRAYKAGWLPYPHQGTVVLEMKEIPQVEVIYLHQKTIKPGGPDPDPNPPKPGVDPGGPKPGTSLNQLLDYLYSLVDSMVPLGGLTSDGIPKTGVEGAAPYWIAGMGLFLAAGVLIRKSLREEQREKRRGGR